MANRARRSCFPTAASGDSSSSAVDDGTRITQSFQVIRAPAVLATLYAIIVPTHRDRTAGLTDDLRRLGELAAEKQGQRLVT